MAFDAISDIRRALGSPLGLSPARVRVPARAHAAGCYFPGDAVPSADAFGALYGTPLVAGVLRAGDWLLFTLTDAFYDACVARALLLPPPPDNSGFVHAVDRMRHLARHGGAGCPRVPALQSALLLALCAHGGRGDYARACLALEGAFSAVPVAARPALTAVSGEFGDACARLLTAYAPHAPENRKD